MPSEEGIRRKKSKENDDEAEGDGEGAGGGGGDNLIQDYKEYHTENSAHFVLTLTPAQMKHAESNGLEKTFKLKSSLAISNMVLYDEQGKIQKYESALEI